MSGRSAYQDSGFVRSIKKFLLSAFVVFTFVAYWLHERQAKPATPAAGTSLPVAGIVPTTADPASAVTPTDSPAAVDPAAGAVPTDTLPAPTATQPPAQAGLYKNGTYSGPEVNAYYGLVQVQVVIQDGKIANVAFLDYPHDRRTSQYINSQAMPWLTQEAIQAQSANVDIISGATLTSEAFIQSMQAALQSARN
ncbi:MAG TPA: FMN-binding protein [Anaerolineales bacterium]|nr:FMN-binding protein [Anaerolineales bacterium]